MNNLTCGSNESRWNALKYVRRVLLYIVIMAVCVALLSAQSGKITAKDQKSADAITAAITALGGEKNINNIKSLILTGTTKYFSHSGVDETEIRILLPDNYLRIEKRIGRGSTIYYKASNGESQRRGFDGTGNALHGSEANEVNRFASLLMGLLLKGDPVAPVTISAASGLSDRFSIAAETEAIEEMEFDPAGKYPLLVSFKDAVTNIGGPVITKTEKGRIISLSTEHKIVDSVMRFTDRVVVDGVMFPGTIVFESGGKTVWELKIEKIQINPKLSLADFELPEYR